MEVEVIVTARVPMPEAYVFRPEGRNRLSGFAAVLLPGGETLDARCLAYVVRHPAAGTILIDTGMHPDASESVRNDYGAVMGMFFRGLRPEPEPYVDQLRALGVDADQVDRVIMTHLHVDHTGGMRLLPNATFVCSRREWEAAHARGAVMRGYVGHHLPQESRMELVDPRADGQPHGPFGATLDLLGDGSIRLIDTPGHTAGHMSVLLHLADGRDVLVVGDAVYTLRSLREEVMPLLTVSDRLYMRSLREIRAFWDENPEAVLVPTHDPTAWQALASERAAA